MSDYLNNLLGKTFNQTPVLQPRQRSKFEPVALVNETIFHPDHIKSENVFGEVPEKQGSKILEERVGSQELRTHKSDHKSLEIVQNGFEEKPETRSIQNTKDHVQEPLNKQTVLNSKEPFQDLPNRDSLLLEREETQVAVSEPINPNQKKILTTSIEQKALDTPNTEQTLSEISNIDQTTQRLASGHPDEHTLGNENKEKTQFQEMKSKKVLTNADSIKLSSLQKNISATDSETSIQEQNLPGRPKLSPNRDRSVRKRSLSDDEIKQPSLNSEPEYKRKSRKSDDRAGKVTRVLDDLLQGLSLNSTSDHQSKSNEPGGKNKITTGVLNERSQSLPQSPIRVNDSKSQKSIEKNETTIKVNIGKIEFGTDATFPPQMETAQTRSPVSAVPVLSLEDYLTQRDK